MGRLRVIGRRLAIEFVVALVWFEFLTSSFALATNGWLEAALGFAVGLGLLLILANKRFLDALERRQLKTGTIGILVAVVLVFAIFEFRNLRFQNLVLLGELQTLDVLRNVRAAGSIVVAVAILWELIRLPKQTSQA